MYKVLVVGNGFDLSAGIKTSYANFIASNNFCKNKDRYLFRHLNSASTLNGWVDVEVFLKNYAFFLSGNPARVRQDFQEVLNIPLDMARYIGQAKSNFFNDFVLLKNALVDYLQSEDIEDKIEFQNGVDSYFSENHLSDPFHAVLNFNYTSNSLSTLFGLSDSRPEIIHLHGSLELNDIVFGVDDEFIDISNDFLFLKKSSHPSYGNFPSLKLAAQHSTEMHFYGLSFGETDNSHFRPLFEFLCSDDARVSINDLSSEGVATDWGGRNPLLRDKLKRRKLIFYVYGRDGYLLVRDRLLYLTSQKFSELKLVNEVEFFDCSVPGFKKIGQEWLNGHRI
jgi:hypothetical protein